MTFLKERVNDLEVFKKNFFTTHYDLIDAREKIALNVLEYLKIITAGANTRIDSLLKQEELDRLNRNMYKFFKRTNDAFENMQQDMDKMVIDISELFAGCEPVLVNH